MHQTRGSGHHWFFDFWFTIAHRAALFSVLHIWYCWLCIVFYLLLCVCGTPHPRALKIQKVLGVKYNSSHDFAMEDFHPLTLQLTARSSKFSRSKICAELSVSLSRADGHLSKKSYEDLYFWFYSQYFLVKLNWKIPSW